MAFRRIPDRWGLIVLLAFLFVPGIITGYLLHSIRWIIIVPAGLISLMLLVAALPIKRKITPQEWADDLEKHLLGAAGPYHWDDTTGVTLADKRLENLRYRISYTNDYASLKTPEIREKLRQIIEALRRGEIPE